MKKAVILTFIVVLMWGCSGGENTLLMAPEEHYSYAQSLYQKHDYQEAILQFQSILLQYPGSAINDDSQYYLGMSYFNREEYLLAAYEFSKLIRDIPASTYVPDSQYMLADCYYELSPDYRLDQTYTEKAIQEFQAFIDYFPLNERVDEVEKKIIELNDKLAKKLYGSAVIYRKMSYNRAAIKYFGLVENTYHDTPYGPKALYDKIQLEIDMDMTAEAKKDIEQFLIRYPDDDNAKDVQGMEETLLSAK